MLHSTSRPIRRSSSSSSSERCTEGSLSAAINEAIPAHALCDADIRDCPFVTTYNPVQYHTHTHTRRLLGSMTSVAGRVKLRRSVTARSDDVWASNADVDVYTHLTRPVVVTMQPEVDHLVECGLVEKALDRSAQANGLTSDGLSGFAAQHCRDTLVSILNADSNLNVTTRRVNQKKKGPFISAQNRLGGSRFRQVSIEQHARTGAARELVEDGTWARIERAVVQRPFMIVNMQPS